MDMCSQAVAQFIDPKLWKEFVITALQGASTGTFTWFHDI